MRRKYHHTISAPLVYALRDRARRKSRKKVSSAAGRGTSPCTSCSLAGLAEMGLEVLPPERERLWNLNAVRVPDNRVEATVRACLLEDHNIEVGAGLGPLAGRIWRVGLMGSGATPENVERLLSALPAALMVGRKA